MPRLSVFMLLIFLVVLFTALPAATAAPADLTAELVSPTAPKALLQTAATCRTEKPEEAADLAARALELLRLQPDKQLELRALEILHRTHKELGQFGTSIAFARKRLLLARELGDREAAASALHSIGICQRYQGAYGEALDSLNQAMAIHGELDNKLRVAKSLNSIGIVYRQLGAYDNALDFYFRALGIEEELENTSGIARTLVNIGIIHKQTGDYQSALDHYDRALKIVENQVWKWNIYNNKGNVYQNLEDYATALDHHRQALEGRHEIGDRSGISSSLLNIGINHLYLGEYDKALESITHSLKLSHELGLKQMIAAGLQTRSTVYQHMGRHEEALAEAGRALAIAEEIQAREVIKDCQEELSEIHAELGNFEEALIWYHKFVETRDSFFSDGAQGKLTYFQERYQTVRKEKEIALLRAGNESALADMEIAEGKLKRQHLVRNYLVVCFALLALLAAVLYNRFRMKKRAHDTLKELNARNEKQKLELQQALDEIKTLSGLLPICSHCKNIRDDQGYWQQIEQFIGEHSEAKFSHGICPDCITKHYPKYAGRI